MHNSRLTIILPYKLDTTNDLLTSRAGLLAIGQLMDSLSLAERIDHYFPPPKSNRGYKPSEYIKTLILMQHEGSFHLDEVRHIQDDEALRTVLDLKKLPQATTLGDWLRRVGNQPQIQDAWVKVNKALLQSALHRCKKVTLDIDATEIIAHKADAKWTYNKNKGFMPMVGHIAETGQVVAVDFRQGNVPPAQDNLAFIQQCQQSLPEGCALNALRIDAAGYQTKIIEYCDTQGIEYAIRAKTSAAMRAQIEAASDSDWLPLLDKQGEVMGGQDTYRTSFCIGDYEKAFTLIIQRTALKGQASLDLDSQESSEAINQGGYVHRAIATNRDELSDSEIIHWYKVNWCVALREGALGYKVNWCVALREGALGYKVNWCVALREGALGYKVNWCVALREGALGYKVNWCVALREGALGYKVNWCVALREGALGYKVNWCVALREGALGHNQRAEDSENRIKELKLDFGGDTLPCPDFNANALYFLISALSYNLFALMRQLLPEELAYPRAMTLRWRL